jgi:SpoVK/Ycf46/Vps4 family AAA+-type ATPase
MAAEALANELEAEFWEIKASDITDKWLGNIKKNYKREKCQ